jgi:energy-coupling factor transporter ATP-binding protein EcfA2
VHLQQVTIQNIRSMTHLVWNQDVAALAGWHVILGGNGSGKSSLLRAIAVALNGPREAAALRLDFSTWLRAGSDKGQISVTVADDPAWDTYKGKGRRRRSTDLLQATLRLERKDGRVELDSIESSNPVRHLWGSGTGWFAASYGPFRRFHGGDKDLEKLYYSYPKISRHLTLFGENVALSECTDWLKNLRFRELENQRAGEADGGVEGRLLKQLREFVNSSDLLPHNTTMNGVSADGVTFVDANDVTVSVDELSDGFRSVLSMTFEIIRQLTAVWSPERLFDEQLRIRAPGLVMIDEIDVHLHPEWQQRIGTWFIDQFPNFQFIVTTHSPLICQAAERGSIFQLPAPGSGETARFIEGVERDRLIYGNVLDAYATDGFGHVATRSEAGVARLEHLAELNVKARAQPLTPMEQAERERLERIFVTG